MTSRSQKTIQVGGTVSSKALYVPRLEDNLFLPEAQAGAWINISGCRTMGKSSLLVRHQDSLKEHGIRVVHTDLVSMCGNQERASTSREWVEKFGRGLAGELGVDEDIVLEPLRRMGDVGAGSYLSRLMFDGVLPLLSGRVLFALDEYDIIRELEYGEDLLFAFRTLQHNQAKRADNRFSLCFIGLLPLTELANSRHGASSPITHSIRMTDFKEDQRTFDALCLAVPNDINLDESFLHRLFYYSGGQPYVTMNLLKRAVGAGTYTVDAIDDIVLQLLDESRNGADLSVFNSIESAFVQLGKDSFSALNAYELLLKNHPEAHGAPGAQILLDLGLARKKDDLLEIKGELWRLRFSEDWAHKKAPRLVASGIEQYRGPSINRGRKRILVINTGGTIGMVPKGPDRKMMAPRDSEEFLAYFTDLESIAEIGFNQLFALDSINVFPQSWKAIAEFIYTHRNDGYDGMVVAHGTDTMAYTASAVAFALGSQLRFPVVFTGAQNRPDVLHGDARVNLYRACEVAKKPIPEVVICFGEYVFRAVRAQKKDDRRFDGFESPTYPPLAIITGDVNIQTQLVRKVGRSNTFGRDMDFRGDFEDRILMVPQFPGLEPEFFQRHVDDVPSSCKGIIIQTVGAGNVANELPYDFMPFIRSAHRKGIPVIITSQYPPDPGTHMQYGPASAPIEAGAIHAGNMTVAAAVTKFRWVLAQVYQDPKWPLLSPDQKKHLVETMMVKTAYVGEFDQVLLKKTRK